MPDAVMPLPLTLQERDALVLLRWRQGLRYLRQNYAQCVQSQEQMLGLNESAAAAKRALNPRSRSKPPRSRIDPRFELAVNSKATKLAAERAGEGANVTQADVDTAAGEIVSHFKPIRGRPENEILRYHVHGFMALYRETFGREVEARITKDSVYEPGFKAPLNVILPSLFSTVDPSVTATSVANIVIQAQRSGAIEGKRFVDLFPFFGGGVDPKTGEVRPGPGFRLERLELATPIYSS